MSQLGKNHPIVAQHLVPLRRVHSRPPVALLVVKPLTMETLLSIAQGGGGGGGASREDVVYDKATELLERLPEDYVEDDYKAKLQKLGGLAVPLNIFLFQVGWIAPSNYSRQELSILSPELLPIWLFSSARISRALAESTESSGNYRYDLITLATLAEIF